MAPPPTEQSDIGTGGSPQGASLQLDVIALPRWALVVLGVVWLPIMAGLYWLGQSRQELVELRKDHDALVRSIAESRRDSAREIEKIRDLAHEVHLDVAGIKAQNQP